MSNTKTIMNNTATAPGSQEPKAAISDALAQAEAAIAALPPSRERSTALTQLDQAAFWAAHATAPKQ